MGMWVSCWAWLFARLMWLVNTSSKKESSVLCWNEIFPLPSCMGWWYSQEFYALLLVANPIVLPRLGSILQPDFPDMFGKPNMRLGSKEGENSVLEKSRNKFSSYTVPFNFLEKKMPLLSLLSLNLNMCTLRMKNTKEDGFEVMVSKIATHSVFFPPLCTLFQPSSKLKGISQGLPGHWSMIEVSSISWHMSGEKGSVLRCLFKAADLGWAAVWTGFKNIDIKKFQSLEETVLFTCDKYRCLGVFS